MGGTLETESEGLDPQAEIDGAKQYMERAEGAADSIQVYEGDDPPMDGSKTLWVQEVEASDEFLAATRAEYNAVLVRLEAVENAVTGALEASY